MCRPQEGTVFGLVFFISGLSLTEEIFPPLPISREEIRNVQRVRGESTVLKFFQQYSTL